MFLTRLMLCVLALLLPSYLFAQSPVSINFSPNEGQKVCPSDTCNAATWSMPEAMRYYFLKSEFECQYEWRIENGILLPGCVTTLTTYTPSVDVLWNNTTNYGKIFCKRINCYVPANNSSDFFMDSIVIMSLNGVLPDPITKSSGAAMPSTLEYGKAHAIGGIKIKKTEHPGTETNQLVLQFADGYEWSLPTGWTAKFGSTVYSGTFSITDKNANVLNDVKTGCGNSLGETIKVRAFFDCKGKRFSEYRELNLTRPAPSPALISNVNVTNYGVTQAFAINAYRPTDATALRYEWSIPTGWVTNVGDSITFQTSNNTITVIPNGINGGNVTVKVTVFCGTDSVESSTVIKNYAFNNRALQPHFVDFEADTTICIGDTALYRIRRDFSNPATLYDWVVTGGFKFVGGIDSVRTSLDSMRVYVPSSHAYGKVRVRAIVPECAEISNWASKPLYGGLPARPRSLSRSVRNLCVGGVYIINILPCLGAVSYEWVSPVILS